ncbi:MAG: glycogen debranching enzyme GlgX [Pseudomonadota bacterium]
MTTKTAPKPAKATAKAAKTTLLYQATKGDPHPLGSTVYPDGVNFSVFSQNAASMELLLFAEGNSTEPFQIIKMTDEGNKSFHFWHIFLVDAKPGLHYAYRVHGPEEKKPGHRFTPEKVLIDPYAYGNSMDLWNRGAACLPGDNLTQSMRSVVIDPLDYDWEGDRPLNRPMQDSVIYEMHVGGFTRAGNSHVTSPGTFRAVIEKIPYLQSLGVTAVELLPVFQFDDTEAHEFEGNKLNNFWGYSTMAYFAPHPGYCESAGEAQHMTEFRDMVKALHKAGIEVILDVVFNHTDEGNHQGPTFSFRGFDNLNYYYLVDGNQDYYYDYTGCGNTFNCNHPVGSKMIVECLRFWVEYMHVDGFRFDEGSVLSRGPGGAPMEFPPVLWQIELDDVLAETKVIAEAWDAAGLYQVGHFPGFRWAEWNGVYRDTLRKFIAGEAGIVGDLADRITGSPSLYQSNGHLPINSVNFITAHDGFTLNDLVSYNNKHNEANGEGNRDGVDDNMSWNCGAEGPTDDPAINALREQQIRNFATLLMLSQGVPMFVMGDEVRRTQGGNNNAWCQDNPIGWFDWTQTQTEAGMLRFWSELISFRKSHPAVHRARFFSGAMNERGMPDISWHGTKLNEPGWNDPHARALAWTVAGSLAHSDIHVMVNMYWEPLTFEIPQIYERAWYTAVNTALPSPQDINAPGNEALVNSHHVEVSGRSIVVLISR